MRNLAQYTDPENIGSVHWFRTLTNLLLVYADSMKSLPSSNGRVIKNIAMDLLEWQESDKPLFYRNSNTGLPDGIIPNHIDNSPEVLNPTFESEGFDERTIVNLNEQTRKSKDFHKEWSETPFGVNAFRNLWKKIYGKDYKGDDQFILSEWKMPNHHIVIYPPDGILRNPDGSPNLADLYKATTWVKQRECKESEQDKFDAMLAASLLNIPKDRDDESDFLGGWKTKEPESFLGSESSTINIHEPGKAF